MLLFAVFMLFALAVYLFILFTVKRDHGHKEPIGALFAAMGFGIVAVLLAGELNHLFVPAQIAENLALESPRQLPLSTLLPAALTIGLIEESLKAIPLATFIYKKRYFDELTDGVIYFGIVGLAFGIVEDIEYTLEHGAEVGLARIIMMPYLHAAFTTLFGICLIQHKVLRKSWIIIPVGLLAAILAHAIYDFFGFVGGFALTAMMATTVGLNILLFVIFRKAQQGDEKRGESAVGVNKFCRHCGKPNPRRTLYCSFCGKHS